LALGGTYDSSKEMALVGSYLVRDSRLTKAKSWLIRQVCTSSFKKFDHRLNQSYLALMKHSKQPNS